MSNRSGAAAPGAGNQPAHGLSGPHSDERAGWLPVGPGEAGGLVAAFMQARAVVRLVLWSGRAGELRRWLAEWRLVLVPGVGASGRPAVRLARRRPGQAGRAAPGRGGGERAG